MNWPRTKQEQVLLQMWNTNHLKNDPKCPAKDKKCGRWGLVGYFKAYCKTKMHSNFTKKKIIPINEIDKEDDNIVFQISQNEETTSCNGVMWAYGYWLSYRLWIQL